VLEHQPLYTFPRAAKSLFLHVQCYWYMRCDFPMISGQYCCGLCQECLCSLPWCLGLRRKREQGTERSGSLWVAECPTGGSEPHARRGADRAAASSERSAACHTPAVALLAEPRILQGLHPPAAAARPCQMCSIRICCPLWCSQLIRSDPSDTLRNLRL